LRQFAIQDLEQARFATAVPAHQSHFLSRFNGERSALQQSLVAIGKGEFASRQQHRRQSSHSGVALSITPRLCLARVSSPHFAFDWLWDLVMFAGLIPSWNLWLS
jgi:hypothetical protein